MRLRKIIFWIFLLIVIDQAIKIVINTFFLEVQFEIIPSLFEFKPTFNDKHSYVNALLYKYFNMNLGLWFHIILFLSAQIIILILYGCLRDNISENKKLLDVAIIFQIAAVICALIGNLIWEKGTLDFMYLKPLFVFDLKDLYLNSFAILFLIFTHKNRTKIKTVKFKDIVVYVENKFKK